ncbi:transposable element Tcb1 transposase [Trichonephila clavipes]|nr:transposable element Tcb1 transposase [Trichonephila clavipes]
MWAGEWNEVVFTDESRICLQHHDGRIRVWTYRGERMLKNSCVMHRHTGPAPGIMVWGGIGYHSRTPLVRIADLIASLVGSLSGSFTDRKHVVHGCSTIDPDYTAATPDQLWQRVEAAWSLLYPKNTSKVSLN